MNKFVHQEMRRSEAASYKQIQRLLKQADPRETLLRLFQSAAPFVIGDPIEMPHSQAGKADYVGTLKDGKTSDYWSLFLSTVSWMGHPMQFCDLFIQNY